MAVVTGLGFDQEIPHHSTFSKNRHGRFQEPNLFQQLFEETVARCLTAGLVRGDHLSVDGSFIEANACKQSPVPREQLDEVSQLNRTVRQCLVELQKQNPIEEPVHQQEQVSTTDLDSTYATKGGTPAGIDVHITLSRVSSYRRSHRGETTHHLFALSRTLRIRPAQGSTRSTAEW